MVKTQWKSSYYVKDKGPGVSSTSNCVPTLLGIALRTSQLLGSAPVRLRRVRGNMILDVWPVLVVFQRLLVIFTSIAMGIGASFDFLSKNHVRVGTTIFTAALTLSEMCLVASICLLRTITAPRTMNILIILLNQMNKINNVLNHGAMKVKRFKFGKLMLFSYIIGAILIHVTEYIRLQFTTNNRFVSSFYASFYYQNVSVRIIQLQVALVIMEITNLVTTLNDHLERLLQSMSDPSKDVINSKHGYLTIRQLAQYYEQICDMVKDVEEDSGPLLLLGFMLLFLQLLLTPYNFISSIVLNRSLEITIQQMCWSIYHLSSLLAIVEPCHWMQDQMERTRYLLSRLARRSADGGDERFNKELELFILQVQIKGCAIAPMGVFTVSRPIVASIIGGVSTYLAIIIQMHKVSEYL